MQDMSTYKTRNAYLAFKRTHKEINILITEESNEELKNYSSVVA